MNARGVVWIVFFAAAAIVLTAWVISRNLGSSRRAKAALSTDQQYRGLAEEYRRLGDLAVTTQEHTDMRLTELSVQMDELRSQIDRLQHILNEVE
jgi:TolA-binding protein